LSEDLIGAIQQILILGKGDQGRLEYLLDLLQKGKPLSDSDQKYLQIMIPFYLAPKDPESNQKNVEFAIEQLHNELKELNETMIKIKRKGFEKYVGRKTILFFVTAFMGWNALQTYIQSTLSGFIPNSITQYIFPINLVAIYFNYGPVIWIAFLILLMSWPFIGSIYLAKFIKSRKISKMSKD
jgi:hypothetical protein